MPVGEVFTDLSLAALDRMYTGYGEKVSQGKIQNRGVDYLRDFPQLDYIERCIIVEDNQPRGTGESVGS